MKIAFTLLGQALGLIVRQPLKTLNVVAPALALMGAAGILTAMVAPELLMLDPARPDLKAITSVNIALMLVATFVLSYALMAVLWHRHTLGDTRTPAPMSLRLLGGYMWRVVMLAMIQLVAGLALVVPLAFATANGAGAAPSVPAMFLTTFLSQLMLLWFSLRLSLILPAAALGHPISVLASWRITGPLSRPLWGVAAALALVNTALTALVAYVDLARPTHALALELPIYVLEGLLIFSVLTTLYARQIKTYDTDGL